MMKNYGTIRVCQCCMLAHANGECCANEQHGGDGFEPLRLVKAPFNLAMGMGHEEHADDCLRHTMHGQEPPDYECDCETDTYSTSQCEGCGSCLHGERYAMTLFHEGE